ncbi:hypothetical protein TMatcc_006150 [Talaromyces marneffei ATCC 18224]|uniref:Uncharacterized protein n=1 Tax=Talaromyces marneffei (strain ATCC 18224 / CBS 334.59 / QM 7333) TaxID=441960 RepID=B6QCG4_TALMQ|nr:uncharacterized protein EYB26_002884 [Talaromyces marneffei]EEA25618.1 hypothetical protein PMAA_067220 [Talaromyces marneffei ATCC 18224]KAE8554332.1 hypothetical protein EYB25_002871 [Talaromyces marneffei]QGA15227.1 hypothetical protein EYB26_002884 [Talaromyces marneffei]
MAPSRINVDTMPESQPEAVTKLSNDASILKDLMEEELRNYKSQRGTIRRIPSYWKSSHRGEYYPRTRKDRHDNAVSWECDSETGCHARTDVDRDNRQSVRTPTKSNGQQMPLLVDDDEPDTTSDNQDDGHEDPEFDEEEEEEQEEDVSLDNYEQLKELYRNCHSSSGENRYSHLLDCSSYNQQNEHSRPHTPGYYITTNPQSRFLNSLKSAAANSNGLSDMFHRAPGTVTLTLMVLLIIAIMLVEMVDVFCFRRRRRSRDNDEEERFRKMTRRRLRTRAVRIPTVTVYESSPVAYESEKTC